MSNQSQPQYPNLLIGVGASAGGLPAIMEIIELLPEQFQGSLVVATHRDPAAPNVLPQLFRNHTRLRVSEPYEGEKISCTHVYVARPDQVMTVDGRDLHLHLDADRLRNLRRIDDLFASIAASAGPNSVGVVLSGMLWDGVEGLRAIKQAGGACIVQHPDDAAFESMPRHALQAVDCDYVGTTMEIASRLVELGAGRSCA